MSDIVQIPFFHSAMPRKISAEPKNAKKIIWHMMRSVIVGGIAGCDKVIFDISCKDSWSCL